MSDNDGVEDAVRGAMRVALTVGGQLGQRGAQLLIQRRLDAQLASEERARELQARYDAERAAARSELAVVQRADWWDNASPDQIGRAWQTARAWRGLDPDADRASEEIARQVRDRYDIDALAPGADRAAVEEALRTRQADAAGRLREAAAAASAEHAAHEARGAESDRERDGAALDEVAAAVILAEPLQTLVPDSEAAGEHAETLYDTAERRQQLADRLDHEGVDAEALESRLLSDVAQGVPTREAIKPAGTKSPKARKTSPRGRQQDRSLGR